MTKVFFITDGNEIVSTCFNKEQFENNLSTFINNNDNEYLRYIGAVVEAYGEVKDGYNDVDVLLLNNFPIKASLNDSSNTFEFNEIKEQNEDDLKKYTVESWIIHS